jgi:hypothetical protein
MDKNWKWNGEKKWHQPKYEPLVFENNDHSIKDVLVIKKILKIWKI